MRRRLPLITFPSYCILRPREAKHQQAAVAMSIAKRIHAEILVDRPCMARHNSMPAAKFSNCTKELYQMAWASIGILPRKKSQTLAEPMNAMLTAMSRRRFRYLIAHGTMR